MIPDRKAQRWFEKTAVVEALGTVPPLVAAAVGALTSLSNGQTRVFGTWLLGGALWMVVASVAKVLHARSHDRDRKRADEYAGFRAAMHVLFAAVRQAGQLSEHERTNGKVRLTIHRVVPNARGGPPEELEQLLPYMGGPGSEPGRRFSIRSGITGQVARWKAALVVRRRSADYETFVGDLVREWAYTDHDARKLSPDRQTWMAVPLIHPREGTLAVVYFDSCDPDFFTEPLQELVLTLCSGLTTYTVEAYP